MGDKDISRFKSDGMRNIRFGKSDKKRNFIFMSLFENVDVWAEDICWFFDEKAMLTVFQALEYPEEIFPPLKTAAEELRRNKGLQAEFLKFHQLWRNDRKNEMEDPKKILWNALVVLSEMPVLFQKHRDLKIPWKVTVDTLRDLPRRMREYFDRGGTWGFDAQTWMHIHMEGKLYQIGRLQYAPGKQRYPANVFWNGKQLIALARPDVGCDEQGWVRKEEEAKWTTTWNEQDGMIEAHAVAADGSIERTVTRLSKKEFRCLLDANSSILHVHIPMGEKLSAASCRESVANAFLFFDRYFPEVQWKAACCSSWLLDRGMKNFLPETSNILAFEKMFFPLPALNTSDHGHYRWVFGKGINAETARKMEAKTRLQRGIVRYVENGGILKTGAGCIIKESWMREATGMPDKA